MKVHNYTPCLFGLLLWKEKGQKNKSVHKIWHKSVSFSFLFFFFFFCFTVVSGQPLRSYTPATKSTSEVIRMRVPIETQQHAMLFAIRKPRWQDDRSCRQLICLMCRFVLCQQYAILFWPEVTFFFFFFFLHSLSICLSVFFFRLVLAKFFFCLW